MGVHLFFTIFTRTISRYAGDNYVIAFFKILNCQANFFNNTNAFMTKGSTRLNRRNLTF